MKLKSLIESFTSKFNTDPFPRIIFQGENYRIIQTDEEGFAIEIPSHDKMKNEKWTCLIEINSKSRHQSDQVLFSLLTGNKLKLTF